MDSVNFDTSHNVFLEFKVAGLFDRILAACIDVVILVIYSIIISIILVQIVLVEGVYIIIALFLPVIFYDLICESLWGGQSIGKKSMKIRVIRVDGLEPTFVQYFLRWILRPVDIWITTGGLAALVVFLNGKGQRIGDMAAGTTVVNIRKAFRLEDTIFSGIDESYIPEFPETAALNDKDISILKDVLNANLLPEVPEAVIDGNYRVKRILEEKMKISTHKPPLEFIQKVILDYNYYNKIAN
ncbi:MAG: RDD family protein [Candidatus Kapabacteria bacterium]|nr:RDD family protein [Candidatus Kapabacteria bacterium]